ncbi:MAG TPA: SpoVR family protein [Thermodesulfobacteriota bacterium]|nr:SpoVR family protein [Thermodesulfobacteriota bacterium]
MIRDQKVELARLAEYDERIQAIAREFGLDFFPQEFDIIPAQKMLEIMAYHFPVNFSHWSFGRDYEMERTKYEHGYSIPYEVVLNSNPSRAYLVNTNPFAVQLMVMAHVYAHNDFMKNNFHFRPTRRDILPSASEAATRFQHYEQKYGVDPVERAIDSGLAIQMNIDPDFFIREESEEETRQRIAHAPSRVESPGPYTDLLPSKKAADAPPQPCRRKTPPEPDRDLLLYLINHSPRPLQEWEKDVLSVIRDQSRYFMPQRRTKIMNEGWAAYWHVRIMERLFQEGLLTEEDHGNFNLYNARVLAEAPNTLNPYLVGIRMFEDIEERWDKGRFGREWEESSDPDKEKNWDLKLGQGRAKIMDIRRSYSDRFFVEHFLTGKLIHKLQLYLFEGRPEGNEVKYVVTDDEWRRVKDLLVKYLSTYAIPLIYVEDGDYKGQRELYLRHAYDGIELDREYREKTIEHVHYLWDRPVHLETLIDGDKVVFTYDGYRHSRIPEEGFYGY